MRKNKVLLSILLVVMIFLCLNGVNAATLSIESGRSEYGTNKVYNKLLDGNITYCISGFSVDPYDNDSCTLTSGILNETQRKVIGQIINNKCSGGCSNFGSDYALTEMTIFEYLEQFNSGIQSSGNANTQATAIAIYQAAETKVAEIDSTNVDVSLNSSSLTFSLENGFYVSNTISVSNASEISGIAFSASGVEGIAVVKTSNSAYVKVPANKITKDTKITLSVTGSQSFPIANVYDCSVGQDVVVPSVYSKEGSSSATGTIVATGSITINKVDVNNNPVKGATITVTGPNNYSVTYTTDGTSKVLNDLEFGEYTIEEVTAPDGYILTKGEKVTLSSEKLSYTVNMVNEKNKVIISKVDATGAKELPGATLEIQDKDGNIVNFCKDAEGNENAACKWVSTEEKYIIEGLPNGTYYLVETIAPEGYVLSKEKVEFIVDNTNPEKNEINVVMKNELYVEVPDTLSGRSALLITIAMIDIALGIGIITYVKKNKITQ